MINSPKQILVLFNEENINSNQTLDDLYLGTTARQSVIKMAYTIGEALKSLKKYEVFYLGICQKESLEEFLNKNSVDLIFNLSESTTNNPFFEIEITELLQKKLIPFTGNSSLTLKIAMNKAECSTLLKKRGIDVPKSYLIENLNDLNKYDFKFPIIVKPNFEDGSTGIEKNNVVKNLIDLKIISEKFLEIKKQPVILQDFIIGREINAAIINTEPVNILGLSEIDFSKLSDPFEQILSYSAKWDQGSFEYEHLCSKKAILDPTLDQKICEITLKVCDAINLKSYGRIDFRIDQNGNPFVIDINPNCDLSEEAGLPILAARNNIRYPDLIEKIVIDSFNYHTRRQAKNVNF